MLAVVVFRYLSSIRKSSLQLLFIIHVFLSTSLICRSCPLSCFLSVKIVILFAAPLFEGSSKKEITTAQHFRGKRSHHCFFIFSTTLSHHTIFPVFFKLVYYLINNTLFPQASYFNASSSSFSCCITCEHVILKNSRINNDLHCIIRSLTFFFSPPLPLLSVVFCVFILLQSFLFFFSFSLSFSSQPLSVGAKDSVFKKRPSWSHHKTAAAAVHH